MYSGSGFKNSELGDIDIVKEGDLYHLFHLVLPNHDYIAHAISSDGFLWKRVKNSLFIGDPGSWDDDMLWTMHTSPDPHGSFSWRMFYTGISRKEMGRLQRIGIARSDDLYEWKKEEGKDVPLMIDGPHYEEALCEGRNWVSCRDPFFFHENEKRLLLISARVPHGPVVRRGCVGIAQETSPNKFEWLPPLFYPRLYDDIEVPSLYKINGRYYLIGNIREDVKVHYWYSEDLFGEYEAFCDNVLLPKGNYAARITKDEDSYLVWNFFTSDLPGEGGHLFPPPKNIVIGKDGHLELQSFSGFDKKVTTRWEQDALTPIRRVLKNPTAKAYIESDQIFLQANSGYELFFLNKNSLNFRLRFNISMQGVGKTGVMCKADNDANGYFISLDLINGFAQIRSWGQCNNGDFDKAFEYKNIQENNFHISPKLTYRIEVICFGGYIELSIDDRIALSLVDTFYMSLSELGIYLESAQVTINNLMLEDLDGPINEDYGPL